MTLPEFTTQLTLPNFNSKYVLTAIPIDELWWGLITLDGRIVEEGEWLHEKQSEALGELRSTFKSLSNQI